MDVSISARHVNITPRLEEVIQEKIGQLDRYLEGLDRADVHLEEARNPRIQDKQICEVVVEGHGHHLRSKVHAPDPYTAVDLAAAKLERQIRKLRTKLQRLAMITPPSRQGWVRLLPVWCARPSLLWAFSNRT